MKLVFELNGAEIAEGGVFSPVFIVAFNVVKEFGGVPQIVKTAAVGYY
ncbi:MAG: hypothetical protein ACJAQT_004993 [Akkermansiaceae bacterium]